MLSVFLVGLCVALAVEAANNKDLDGQIRSLCEYMNKNGQPSMFGPRQMPGKVVRVSCNGEDDRGELSVSLEFECRPHSFCLCSCSSELVAREVA